MWVLALVLPVLLPEPGSGPASVLVLPALARQPQRPSPGLLR